MSSYFALVLILVQILSSGKEACIFVVGKESHSALFCEAKPYSFLMGKGRKRNAAVENKLQQHCWSLFPSLFSASVSKCEGS